jgi:hypothetical protein
MSTSLMPLDPALSPQQVTRLLPIRASLLPAEITDRRRARQMRIIVIAGLVLVLVAIGGWYASAARDRSAAQRDLDTANAQIAKANKRLTDSDLADVTRTTNANNEVTAQLKTLMATDLPWSTLLNRLRATGTSSKVTIARVTASLSGANASTNALPSTTTASTVATLTIEGAAADKKTIAGFIDNLGKTTGIANPFLTSASQASDQTSTTFTFTANADVTSVMLCGRFTTACKAGGN